jgi:hypothetical protein
MTSISVREGMYLNEPMVETSRALVQRIAVVFHLRFHVLAQVKKSGGDL